MRVREIRQFCKLQDEYQSLMQAVMTQLNLSARAYHRILKLVRTIADLAGGRGDQIIDNIWSEKKNHRHLSPKYIWQNHKSRAGYPKLFHFGVDVGATVSKLAGVT